jgi:hypothetical protein
VRVDFASYLVAAASNLVRLARLTTWLLPPETPAQRAAVYVIPTTPDDSHLRSNSHAGRSSPQIHIRRDLEGIFRRTEELSGGKH